MASELRSIVVDGNHVVYENFGDGHEALIFIHGWCCSRSLWHFQAPLFEKHRAILIDLPGHGSSDSLEIDYTLEIFASAVKAVVEHEKVTAAILIGHSMGGPVATMTLRLLPRVVSAIVYVDSFFHVPESYLSTADKLERSRMLSDEDWCRNHLQQFMTEKTPAPVWSEIVRTMMATSKHVRTHSVTTPIAPPQFRYNETYDISALHITTSVYADIDKSWLHHIPRLQSNLWEGHGHFLFMEDPEYFNDQIELFLANHGY